MAMTQALRCVAGAAGAVWMLAAAPAWAAGAGASAPVALVELEGKLPQQPGPLDWLTGGQTTFPQLVRRLREAAGDDALRGVVLRLKDAELSATQVEELAESMQALRRAGKKVHVYSDMFGPSELLLGAAADEVLAQAGTPVSLPGLYVEEMYLADTLGWMGLKADFVQVGDYKGASEPMARNAPSPEWDQNINGLLDSMYATMTSRLAQGRGMDKAKLEKAMESAWMADAEEAVGLGLIDAQVDLPDLGGRLEEVYGAPVSWREDLVDDGSEAPDMSNPFAMLQMLSKTPDTTPDGPTIAVLHLSGPIVDGESTSGGFMGEASIGSRTVRRELERLKDEDLIKGVVVRIDSPGGSATASEVIWQGLRALAAEKPVWASVGSMAASGGYYIAVGTDKIYLNPSSIVGSIGVVGGKIAMNGLYEWGRVNVVPRARGPRAAMFSSVSLWSDAERELVRGKMSRVYEQFTGRVRAGRPQIDLSKTAEGRLFTGEQAVALKMADQIGGLERTIADLADSLGLEEYEVMDFPAPKSLNEVLEESFKGLPMAAAPGILGAREGSAVRAVGSELLGERGWNQLSWHVRGLMELREEPIILMSPRALIFR